MKPKLDYKMAEPTVYDEKIRSQRLKNTLELMGDIKEPALDVGASNQFGQQLADIMKLCSVFANGNL